MLVFFDDILIYSSIMEEHKKHLSAVLQCLQQHQLFVKLSKCSFARPSVEYLGHIILALGVSADPEKIQCMRDWPKPSSIKALRWFLGLTGYYRKFVSG